MGAWVARVAHQRPSPTQPRPTPGPCTPLYARRSCCCCSSMHVKKRRRCAAAGPRCRGRAPPAAGSRRRLLPRHTCDSNTLPLARCPPGAQLLDVFGCIEQLHDSDLHKMLSQEQGEYRCGAHQLAPAWGMWCRGAPLRTPSMAAHQACMPASRHMAAAAAGLTACRGPARCPRACWCRSCSWRCPATSWAAWCAAACLCEGGWGTEAEPAALLVGRAGAGAGCLRPSPLSPPPLLLALHSCRASPRCRRTRRPRS